MIRIDMLRQNLERVRDEIAEAATQAGRSANEVRLVVVTKGHSSEILDELLELGAVDIGESYAEEALEKQAKVDNMETANWHMIGHVQGRKAKLVPGNFDMLHSLDSLKLARRVDSSAGEDGVKLPVLLQVNVGGEDSKYGWRVDADLADFHADVEQILALENVKVQGLMTIPPIVESPEEARPYFERLRTLRDELAGRYPESSWKQLSMGMSGDFPAAIKEGATMIRVGTAIVGPRPN